MSGGADLIYELDDPRPIAAAAPYTYFLPTNERLAAVGPGDRVKLLFRSLNLSSKYAVERMWVLVQLMEEDHLVGVLDNEPFDMQGLARGARVRFERFHIISVEFGSEEKENQILSPSRRGYWERCLVDRCVLDDGVKVGFLYREEPEPMDAKDKYPDSGWRIRGDGRGWSDDELDTREVVFVALGAVLNRDDSWLSLIDEPVGSVFVRDFETDDFHPATGD